jgi:adenine-specific DNA-methyltransferase
MNKLDMKSKDIVNDNLEYIKEKFPEVIKEYNGKYAIDFDVLKENLSDVVISDSKERFQLTWPGKIQSLHDSNRVISKTLRPVYDKSINFDKTKNIYIEGDNLEALQIIRESYLNKIKCIYIDPPYNTGRNLIYKNDYSKSEKEELADNGDIDENNNKLTTNPLSNGRFHSDWLSMMYSRLKVARDLLTKDGVLICAIDENEVNTLGIILQEIFNSEEHCITIVHNPRGIQGTNFSYTHEYAYFVFKSSDVKLCDRKIEEKDIDWRNLRDNGSESLRTDARNCFYPILVKDSKVIGFGDVVTDENNHPNQNETIDGITYVYPIDKQGIERKWRYARQSVDNIIDMLKPNNINGKIEILLGKNFGTYRTVWEDSRYDANEYGKKLLNGLVPNNPFDFPKSLWTVYDCIYAVVGKDKNAMVLDFFSGSATTAHAVMQMNSEDNGERKFIMVQYPEKGNEYYDTICDVGQARIKAAGEKLKEEQHVDIDYGFRVYKIDDSNMKDEFYMTPDKVSQEQIKLFEDNIKEDRTPEDLITQVILNLGLKLDLPIEEKNICGNKVFDVDDGELLACFDDNVSIDIIEEIAKINPRQIVFRDSSFATDQDKVNFEERLKRLSAGTKFNVL